MSTIQLQNIIEEVKARADIIEIIGQYTRLKRSGKSWTGLCPFHDDKRPSFNVNPLGFYRCFSCGEKGDIFTFIQKKEGLEFMEALEMLAKRVGVSFDRNALSGTPEKQSEREEMLALNRMAVDFYRDRLSKSQDTIDYLSRRAILKETQDQFEIGFAPPDWEGLTYYLQRKNVNMALACRIGLVKQRAESHSGYYDAFRNRLMLPIHDISGRVIAFGGRTLGDDKAKYLNSENSPLFDKSRILYGLYYARKRLSGSVPAVFVEGYLDVITSHQAGFTQCIATLGTSMTEEHVRLLARYNPKAIICYDGDSAGIKATLRGAEVWDQAGIEGAEIRVARLPEGEDPDSLLRKGGSAAFQIALDNAIPRLDFEIERLLAAHNLQSEDGRAAAYQEVLPLLAGVLSPAQRSVYANQLLRLHPLNGRMDTNYVVKVFLVDIDQHSKSIKRPVTPRQKGYPLTRESNQQPLNEQPGNSTFEEPPLPEPPADFPMTQHVVGRRDGDQKYMPRRRDQDKPSRLSDPSLPSLQPPSLTGYEKAERQLLKALFSAEWRTLILSLLKPEMLISDEGKQLYHWVARTQPRPDGTIDPRDILQASIINDANVEVDDEDPYAGWDTSDEDPHSQENDSNEVQYAPDSLDKAENAISMQAGNSDVTESAGKMYRLIEELLEDSSILVSNEELNEIGVRDCISRLEKHHHEMEKRQLEEMIGRLGTLSPEEKLAVVRLFIQKMRESRSSPKTKES